MADEEVGSTHYAEERWSLLNSLKCTVENILMSNFENGKVTTGSSPHVEFDLERIFEHGLRKNQRTGQDKGERNTMVVVSPFDESVQGDLTDAIEDILEKFHQAFLGCSLSASNLSQLVNNRKKIHCLYQDYAFLRSNPHVEAMCTCIQALENGDFQLLAKIDNILLNKKKYIDLWLQGSVNFNTGLLQSSIIDKDIQGKDVEELPSSNSSGCSSEKDFCQNVSLYNSPEESNIEITDESVHPSVGLQENQQYCPGSGHNCSYLPTNINDQTLEHQCLRSGSHTEQIVRENVKVNWSSQTSTTFGPLKTRDSVRATLAYAALSAVMESDEGIPYTAMWLDATDDKKSCKVRRASTGSLNKFFLHSQSDKLINNGMLEAANLETNSAGSCGKNVNSSTESVTEYQTRKAIGHNRSKSDQLGVTQIQKHEFINDLALSGGNKENSCSDLNRLSSSLPATSESLYCIDPYMDDPYQEKSLATLLASQDFSSCELDKENAHFSISEALIAAIEQMKCDAVNASEEEEEEEEEDEEILYLKKELERKRWEKRQRKSLQEQAAFSDEATQSTASEPSMQTNSSRSVFDSEDELSTEWEELSPTDEQLQENNEFRTSNATPSYPSSVTDTVLDSVHNPNSKLHYTQLSAEAVAKSLLQKFANQKHPAAWELQWLVSFQDAPQSLLPLPDTVAVAPDDILQVEALENKLMSRQNSLPSRIRGNSEWAPPRAQIIFHTHKPPRRKECMRQQNFRCAGCGMAVSPDYMRRFRYCHYLGKYFCSTCHNNVLEVIPARVLRKWDFAKYEVSNFARDLLHRICFDPLFNLMDLNPSLFKRIRVLERLKDVRRRLHFFKSFIQTCRKAEELAEEFNKIPDHICGEPHVYSLHDLLQVHDGDLHQFLNKLAVESLNHINHCQLCLAKGFICEYCKDGKDVIFPFMLNRVVQCLGCRASFHKECFVEGKCPKCERIRVRKQVLSEAVSPEEEQILEY